MNDELWDEYFLTIPNLFLKPKRQILKSKVKRQVMISVSAPGRICLFGEHQDYLGLPVIAAGISRRIVIEGEHRNDNLIVINMPDIGVVEKFLLEKNYAYTKPHDYLRSVLNTVMRDTSCTFSRGFECTVRSTIPINSGTSSSSALVVAWIQFLTRIADVPQYLSPFEVANMAYEAEVSAFGGHGGMMDQFSIALGNCIYLTSQPTIEVENLSPQLGAFVLGDSLQEKDTQQILKHVKYGMLAALDKIKKVNPVFNITQVNTEDADDYKNLLTSDELILVKGNISDHKILCVAKKLLESNTVNDAELGQLLTLHQNNLRDAKRISTEKINRMLEAAMNAGALGGKINGSGGGGCMFVYAPLNPEKVAEAIEKAGGKAHIIYVDKGVF